MSLFIMWSLQGHLVASDITTRFFSMVSLDLIIIIIFKYCIIVRFLMYALRVCQIVLLVASIWYLTVVHSFTSQEVSCLAGTTLQRFFSHRCLSGPLVGEISRGVVDISVYTVLYNFVACIFVEVWRVEVQTYQSHVLILCKCVRRAFYLHTTVVRCHAIRTLMQTTVF